MSARTLYDACVQVESPIARRLRELERPETWLAKRLGVSPSSVNRWIKGKQPILPHRRREIALALGMSVDDIQLVPSQLRPADEAEAVA